MKIYIVNGSTGEYSDRTEWVVCAYTDEKRAEEHATKAEMRAKELQATRPSRYDIEPGANEFDPSMVMDYTGTFYSYTVTELIMEKNEDNKAPTN